MDERLQAGRHHLSIGDRALRDGFLDDSRSHFQAALLQFRGPELRLGEAHAMRGLAEVELHCGNVSAAESGARDAVHCYQEVRAQLQRVDEEGVSIDLNRDAEEGEAAALVLLGDLLLRTGRGDEARRSLSYARELYGGLGDVPSAAGVWVALGRLGLREGRYADALAALDRAIALHERSGDAPGQCVAWLLRAEVDRLSGAFEEAAACLDHAQRLADQTKQPALRGRAWSSRGSLQLQQRELQPAYESYGRALELLREAGDAELEAFALLGQGAVRSRMGDIQSVHQIVEAGRLLASLEHRHGLGSAMLRLSEHAMRVGLPVYALAAAESARQLWQLSDPVRGVGQALRLQVKALADLQKWPAVITVAHARAVVAGHQQPNAIEVRDFYRERAPVSLLSDLDLLDDDQYATQAESMVEALLEPMLRGMDLDFQSLGVVGGATAILGAVLRATPAPAPTRSQAPEPAALDESEAPQPIEKRGEYDGLYSPPSASDAEPEPAPEPEHEAEHEAEVAPAVDDAADPYAGLYSPPSFEE